MLTCGMLTICSRQLCQCGLFEIYGPYVCAHARHEDDASFGLSLDHVLGNLASTKEGSMNVDIIQLPHAARGVLHCGIVLNNTCPSQVDESVSGMQDV